MSQDNWHLYGDAFKDYTGKLDQRRGEDFAKVIPEFGRLLD